MFKGQSAPSTQLCLSVALASLLVAVPLLAFAQSPEDMIQDAEPAAATPAPAPPAKPQPAAPAQQPPKTSEEPPAAAAATQSVATPPPAVQPSAPPATAPPSVNAAAPAATPSPQADRPQAAPNAASTEKAPEDPAAATAEGEPAKNRARPVGAKTRRKGRAPSRKTARASGNFSMPLRFDPADNGLSVDNPQLKWIFRESEDVIDFGDFPISSSDIAITLDQIKRSQAPVKYDARKTEPWVTALSMRWPDRMTRVGDVSIENLQGETLWHFNVGENERKAWRDEFEYTTPDMKKNHKDASWGRYDLVRSEFEFLYKGGLFRACLTFEETVAERLRICSAAFRSKSKGNLIRFFPVREKDQAPKILPPGFYLADKKLKDTGILNFPIGKPLELKVQFKSGATIEISSQPADPKLLDVVESPSGKEIIMTGAGAMPVGQRVRIIKKPVTHFWAPTGIPQDKVWQASFPADSPTLAVHGAFNIPFTLLFTYDQLPREEDRIFIEKTRSSGTFSSDSVIKGYIPSAGDVSSTESSASKTDPYHFDWRFASPKRGEENRARITIDNKEGGRPWVANYRLFRSYPSEVSGRMTGIMEADYTVLILGEISAAHYLETLGSYQDPRFSKQRWGIAGRYFKSLSTIQSSNGTGVSEFSVLNVDLKYHILPGVWHRDELVGMTLSTEQISIAGINVLLLGSGAYWARTMPKIFNDLFNLLPFMEYPKYVDMEFIYYPFSLSSGVTGGLSFSLNFHGRVFWTERFYGELGFGLRNYQFSTPSQNRVGYTSNVSLLTSYGTAGLGFIF